MIVMKPRLAPIANVIRVQDPQTYKFATGKGWSRRPDEGLVFSSLGQAEDFCRSREMSAATAYIEGRGPVVITIPLVLNMATFLGSKRRCRMRHLERTS